VEDGGWWWEEVRCGEVASVKPFYTPEAGAAVNLGAGAADGGAESITP
jgi:hypothetical protein